MRTFKLALAAGVSIVVATKFSPALALPAFPLDANGPVRQGDMCIAQRAPHAWDGLFDDTGPGYDRFEYCRTRPRARTAHVRRHRGYPVAVAALPPPHRDPWAIGPAVYRRLDTNGPIRQGTMCIARRAPRAWDGLFMDTGPGYDYFEYCGPVFGHHRRHAHGGHHHYRHAHVARHHHQKHRLHHRHHRRHAQYLTSLWCDSGNDTDTLQVIQENLQQYLQQYVAPDAGADVVETIANAIDGGTDLAANVDVADGADGVEHAAASAIAIQGPQDNGGLLAQLFAADQARADKAAWTLVASGAQVSHSMLRHGAGERSWNIRPVSGEHRAPVAPAPSPQLAFAPRPGEPQFRHPEVEPDQSALTRVGYMSPPRSDAGGGMPVTTGDNGYSPIAAVIGLALIFAAPITLVAAKLPVADKAAVVETVLDPLAETEWYIPANRPLTLDQRTASAAPVARSAAPIRSALAAIF
jgi:hypothetical protein